MSRNMCVECLAVFVEQLVKVAALQHEASRLHLNMFDPFGEPESEGNKKSEPQKVKDVNKPMKSKKAQKPRNISMNAMQGKNKANKPMKSNKVKRPRNINVSTMQGKHKANAGMKINRVNKQPRNISVKATQGKNKANMPMKCKKDNAPRKKNVKTNVKKNHVD